MKDMYNTGSELDSRLETVMESHRAETTTKQSSEPDTVSGLRAYAERPTIAEEIANIDVSKVAHVDLHQELAGDQMDGIMAARSAKLSAFHEAVKAATATAATDPIKIATDLIRSGVDPQEAAQQALKLAGIGGHAKSLVDAARKHPDVVAEGAVMGAGAAAVGAAAHKLRKKHED